MAVYMNLDQCSLYYVKPITLKFKINPKIPVLHVVNTIPTKFQSKILAFGVMAAIWSSDQKLQKYITNVNWFPKFLNVIDGHEKTDLL